MSGKLAEDLAGLTQSVTKSWKQAQRKRDRADRVSRERLQRMRYGPRRTTIREVAFAVMEDAYNRASSYGKYYANARQIFYAARPAILARADSADALNSVYFTQTLLKDYIQIFRPGWKVVWDARGHLVEPHTSNTISLGGLEVRQYRTSWSTVINDDAPPPQRIETRGPRNRYSSALFIEKEGFNESLKDSGICERYDMALMSTKGIPVDAACDLIADLSEEGVRVFVLHDFDLAGFKILSTLQRGTRLGQATPVIDLGFRLADVAGLQSEPVHYKQRNDPRRYLRQQGVTVDECAFLVQRGNWQEGWSGERVELNAMTTEALVTWLEGKLQAHGVQKVVPDTDVLGAAYRRDVIIQRIQTVRERIVKQADDVPPAEGLRERIEALLAEDAAMSWDSAVWQVAAEAAKDGV